MKVLGSRVWGFNFWGESGFIGMFGGMGLGGSGSGECTRSGALVAAACRTRTLLHMIVIGCWFWGLGLPESTEKSILRYMGYPKP